VYLFDFEMREIYLSPSFKFVKDVCSMNSHSGIREPVLQGSWSIHCTYQIFPRFLLPFLDIWHFDICTKSKKVYVEIFLKYANAKDIFQQIFEGLFFLRLEFLN